MSDLDSRRRATLRILASIAKADGELDPAERQEIARIFDGDSTSVDEALAGDIDIDAELTQIGDDEDYRRRLYRAAYAVAHADGWASTDEVNQLNKIYPDEREATLFKQVLGEALDTVSMGNILPVADPVRRRIEITEDTMKYATLSALIGAVPFPVVSDCMVVGFQVKLVMDIGRYWGHQVDRAEAMSLMASVGVSVGLRVAVNALAKLVPGWGSAFGAATSFASTFAIGEAANAWFKSGKEMSDDALQSVFQNARLAGRDHYDENKSVIEEKRFMVSDTLSQLGDQLATGEMSVTQASEMLDAAYDGPRPQS